MARQGKIARLPQALREELNRRLLDGESGARILPWLNALPEVIKLLEEDFEGLRINDQNLSDWRLGGYEDWLRRRDRLEATKEMAGYAVKLAKANGGNISEGASAILAGQILEVLEGVGAGAGQQQLTAEAVQQLTNSLASLRSGDHSKKVLEQNERRLAQNERKLAQMDERIRLLRESFLIKTLDAGVMAKVSAIAQDNSLDNAAKIAALRKVYFADVDELEKSGEVKLPD
jgi:Protein of unknown function (DUF3486)